MLIDALVEGSSDAAVARKVITICEHEVGTVYGKRGYIWL